MAKYQGKDFWDLVSQFDGCWLWQGNINPASGYGRLTNGYKNFPAHRISWMRFNGCPIPEGQSVLHHCDNPPCVRPDHLFLGTQAENLADMHSKNRGKYGSQIKNSKIKEPDALVVRALCDLGVSQRTVGALYGLSQQTVSKIAMRRIWVRACA